MRLWVYLLLFIAAPAMGQDPVYRMLTNQDGLPSNTIYYVMQDQTGFIWLGHDKGISRYDGSRFVNYKASMRQGYSLSNLMQAANGQMWAQDFSGNFYFSRADSMVNEPGFNTTGTYVQAGIIGGHWLVSLKNDSLRTLHTLTRQRSSLPMPGDYHSAVCFDKDALYFVSDDKLYRYDGRQLSVNMHLSQRVPGIFFLQRTSWGFVAFAKVGQPQAYRIQNGRVKPLALFPTSLFIQEVNRTGREIWVSTTSGAYCFDDEDLKPLYGGHSFFGGSSISRVIRDREGSYWMGTLDKGLFMIPNIQARMYSYQNEAFTALATKDDNTLLAGTSLHRLLSLNTRTNEFRLLYKAPTNHEIIHIYHDEPRNETLLCSDKITYLRNFALQRQYIRAGKNVVPIAYPWFAFAYASGFGFISLAGAADTLMPPTMRYMQPLKRPQMRGRWVLYRQQDSTLLTATSQGLQYFGPGKSGTVLYEGRPVYASSLQQDGQQIFVATYDQGVLILDSLMQVRPMAAGITRGSIYKMQVYPNELWLLTDRAVVCYNRSTHQVQTYSAADGLPQAEFKDLMRHHGRIYVATTQGLVHFDAAMPAANHVPPVIALNQVLVNEKIVNGQNGLKLSSQENNLHISFSVLAYKQPDAQMVRYKLNDQPWQTLEPGVRMLYLSALAAGSYVLQVQAFNEDGIPAAQPLQLQFSIAAPLYRQWWFLLLAASLIMGSVYAYFKIRLRRLQQENRLRKRQMLLEQELHKSRMASIKSQMNPHFFYNALNTIQSYIYTNDKEEAVNYLNQFSELTRMVLDMSNKDLISLSDELKALRHYLDLEALRFEGKLQYSLSTSPGMLPDQFWLPPMLVQPYVENAIKHGLLHSKKEWQLHVVFSARPNGLQVVIDDNGIGRKRSEELNAHRYRQHASFAMSANEKRLQILNKGLKHIISVSITDKYDELGMAAGTTVTLHVPTQTGQTKA